MSLELDLQQQQIRQLENMTKYSVYASKVPEKLVSTFENNPMTAMNTLIPLGVSRDISGAVILTENQLRLSADFVKTAFAEEDIENSEELLSYLYIYRKTVSNLDVHPSLKKMVPLGTVESSTAMMSDAKFTRHFEETLTDICASVLRVEPVIVMTDSKTVCVTLMYNGSQLKQTFPVYLIKKYFSRTYAWCIFIKILSKIKEDIDNDVHVIDGDLVRSLISKVLDRLTIAYR